VFAPVLVESERDVGSRNEVVRESKALGGATIPIEIELCGATLRVATRHGRCGRLRGSCGSLGARLAMCTYGWYSTP
jgi:hypothetical protein